MKKMMKSALSLMIMALAAAAMVFLAPEADAAGADYVAGFPLPATKTYQVSVLENYSSGAIHKTYTYRYILKTTEDRLSVMDISAPGGTPIYAVADGRVHSTSRNDDGDGGNWIVLQHADGSYSYYGHLKAAALYKKGAPVKAGDTLGYVGKTGLASGNHLHFEWSGHDPFCMYEKQGLVKIMADSGASRYPHKHTLPTISTDPVVYVTGDTIRISATIDNPGRYLVEDYGVSLEEQGKTGYILAGGLDEMSSSALIRPTSEPVAVKQGKAYTVTSYMVCDGRVYNGGFITFVVPKTATVKPQVLKITDSSAMLDLTVKNPEKKTVGNIWYELYVGSKKAAYCAPANLDSKDKTTGLCFDLDMLKAGTTYTCKCYAEVGGKTVASTPVTFTTAQALPELDAGKSVAAPQRLSNNAALQQAFTAVQQAPTLVKNEVKSEAKTSSVKFSGFSVQNITAANAKPSCTVTYTGSRPSQVGLYLGTSSSSLRKVASDKINHGKNPFDAWYDINKEADMCLLSGTTYYYKFYAVIDGVEHTSAVQSFTTKAEQKTAPVKFSNLTVQNVTAANAKPSCTVTYTGSRPSQVGLYLGTSSSSLRKVAGDKINHSKNPFDAWYDINKEADMCLLSRTTYSYKFYAVIDGVEYTSSVQTFTTK